MSILNKYWNILRLKPSNIFFMFANSKKQKDSSKIRRVFIRRVCWAFVRHFYFLCLSDNPETRMITGRSDTI